MTKENKKNNGPDIEELCYQFAINVKLHMRIWAPDSHNRVFNSSSEGRIRVEPSFVYKEGAFVGKNGVRLSTEDVFWLKQSECYMQNLELLTQAAIESFGEEGARRLVPPGFHDIKNATYALRKIEAPTLASLM